MMRVFAGKEGCGFSRESSSIYRGWGRLGDWGAMNGGKNTRPWETAGLESRSTEKLASSDSQEREESHTVGDPAKFRKGR